VLPVAGDLTSHYPLGDTTAYPLGDTSAKMRTFRAGPA
jgi:hypothetical protein